MSEMRRLRQEMQNELALALLDSVDADRSEVGACDRALESLGLTAASAVAAMAAAKVTAVTRGVAGGAGTLSMPPGAAQVSALLVAKWVGIGMLGGAVAVGAFESGRLTAGPSVTSSPMSSTASLPAATRSVLPASVGPDPPPGTSVVATHAVGVGAATASAASAMQPTEARPPTPAAVSPVRAERAPADVPPSADPEPALEHARSEQPHAGDDLASPATAADAVPEPILQQLSALSAIHAALGAGDPQRALTLLGEFDSRNPTSPLTEEVTVLRIDALVDAGRAAGARALAEAFVRAHPQSAYGEHVRSKLRFSDQNGVVLH